MLATIRNAVAETALFLRPNKPENQKMIHDIVKKIRWTRTKHIYH